MRFQFVRTTADVSSRTIVATLLSNISGSPQASHPTYRFVGFDPLEMTKRFYIQWVFLIMAHHADRKSSFKLPPTSEAKYGQTSQQIRRTRVSLIAVQ